MRFRIKCVSFLYGSYRKFNIADSRSANMTTGGVSRSFWPHIRGPVPGPLDESISSRYPETQLETNVNNIKYDRISFSRFLLFNTIYRRRKLCEDNKSARFRCSGFCYTWSSPSYISAITVVLLN